MSPESPIVWVLADPRAGTAAQALGIAERLGGGHRVVPLEWGPLARLPLPIPTLAGLRDRGAFVLPWPRLAISAGRRSAPVARWLAARGVRIVHCMRAWPATGIDLMVIGCHDHPAEAPNILPILGATHGLTPDRLRDARAAAPELAALPSPRIALLVGGKVRGEGLDPALAAGLGARVAGFAGSVMATTSRRTGEAAADALVVTGDSISMLSESLVTAAPIFIAPLGGEGPRHLAMHESLYAAGHARPISAAPAPFPRRPLDETGRVAAEIRARGWLG